MEIRLDPVTNQPTLLVPARAKRPHYGRTKPVHPAIDRNRVSEDNKLNPFAPGNEHVTGPEVWADSDNPERLPNDPDWKVRVVPNKYPIVPHHEVIIISPDNNKDISQVSSRQAQRIVRSFVNRTKEMEKFGQSFLFCNHGAAAGASISHPHAQILALPTLYPSVRKEVELLKKGYDKSGNCLHCQLVDKEAALEKRVVWQNEHFVIISPESSGWPYAMSIYPKIHQASFASIKEHQLADFAEGLQLLVSLYHQVLQRPPYNYWIHSVKGHFYHWHLDIVPRIKMLAGVELGAGIMINDRISPEDAAKEFRLALKSIKR